MNYTINTKKEDYIKTALNTLDFCLKLTEYERDLLSTMLTSGIKTIDMKTRKDLTVLMDTDYYTLTNYIKRLKDKNLLVDTGYGLAVSAELVNLLDDKQIVITFKIQNENN